MRATRRSVTEKVSISAPPFLPAPHPSERRGGEPGSASQSPVNTSPCSALPRSCPSLPNRWSVCRTIAYSPRDDDVNVRASMTQWCSFQPSSTFFQMSLGERRLSRPTAPDDEPGGSSQKTRDRFDLSSTSLCGTLGPRMESESAERRTCPRAQGAFFSWFGYADRPLEPKATRSLRAQHKTLPAIRRSAETEPRTRPQTVDLRSQGTCRHGSLSRARPPPLPNRPTGHRRVERFRRRRGFSCVPSRPSGPAAPTPPLRKPDSLLADRGAGQWGARDGLRRSICGPVPGAKPTLR